jgi:hypothetical protein
MDLQAGMDDPGDLAGVLAWLTLALELGDLETAAAMLSTS